MESRTGERNNNKNNNNEISERNQEDVRIIINSWKNDDTYIYNGGTVRRQEKKKIRHVVVADSVTVISRQAFERCTLLESVTFSSPSSLQQIEDRAFMQCRALQAAVLPRTVQEIGKKAFYQCDMLMSPVFFEPTSSSSSTSESTPALRSIEKDAFSGCCSLTYIEFPKSLQTLGRYAFACCSGLTSVKFSSSSSSSPSSSPSLTRIPTCCFMFCKALRKLTLPCHLKVIERAAFSGCGKLSTVHLPDSLEVIARSAFRYCRSMKQIIIPKSVQRIGAETFVSCTGMTDVIMQSPGTLRRIGYGTFNECHNLQTINLQDQPMLEEISEEVFRNCLSLRRVKLPSTIQKIKNRAFEGCSRLFIVDFGSPSTATMTTLQRYRNEIEDDVGCCYSRCDGSGRMIRLPESIQYIGSDAFVRCSRLNRIINKQSLLFVSDNALIRKFLYHSIDIPLSLRSYIICSKHQDEYFQRNKQKLQQAQMLRTLGRPIKENESKCCPSKIDPIRQASLIYYLLIHDGILWKQR